MKYVLMYTDRPDLDAAVPEEHRAEVVGDLGCRSRSTARSWPTVAPNCEARDCDDGRVRADGGEPVVVDGPFYEAKEVSEVSAGRRSRPRCRDRHRQGVALIAVSGRCG